MWILNALYNLQLLVFGKNIVHYFIINFWHITECLLCYKAETKDKEMTFSVWILWECRDASCIVWELSLSWTYLQENLLPWVKCKCLLICNDNTKSTELCMYSISRIMILATFGTEYSQTHLQWKWSVWHLVYCFRYSVVPI
jgi:hypothetical protein